MRDKREKRKAIPLFVLLFLTTFSLIPTCIAFSGNAENGGTDYVVERETGFIWQRSEAPSMLWEEAINHCESLKLEGISKWRLPNIKELQSLVNTGTTKPATDLEKFPEVQFSEYWTSTTYVSSSYAYCVNFTTGVAGYCNKGQKKYVRCIKNIEKPERQGDKITRSD